MTVNKTTATRSYRRMAPCPRIEAALHGGVSFGGSDDPPIFFLSLGGFQALP